MARMPAPTRGNLVKIQRQLTQAKNGRDLLDQKRQVLMNELVHRIDSAKELQSEVAQVFDDAYDALRTANLSLGIDAVEDIAASVPDTDEIVVRLRSIMGVEIPDIDPLKEEIDPCWSICDLTGVMDDAYLRFRRVLATIVKLAEVETSIYRLAVQIRKTHRRVNALDKVVMPMAAAQMRYINDVLEESDREDFSRMKSAKNNREKRSEA